MNFSFVLPWRKGPVYSRAARQADEPPGDGHSACGWFDSSHALNSGLQVQEHATVDSLGAELPLARWLDLHLGGWSAPAPRHTACPETHTAFTNTQA